MRILLSEGSGLTSRQVAGRLGELGHEVHILSATRVCLARFTRHVRKVHLVPRFGLDPFGWLDEAQAVAERIRADLLFPTHDQVAVLSALQRSLRIATIVPPFEGLRRVQDKIGAFRALREIGAPQPWSIVLESSVDLQRVKGFPAFLKCPVGTASTGVCRVNSPAELAAAAEGFGLGATNLLAQAEVPGPLVMAQAVADGGRLTAHHASLRLSEGVGGGAAKKESLVSPEITLWLTRLVAFLNWRGGLSMDFIIGPDGPVVIDVNPRLVEPGNASFAGVDLVGAMLDLVGGTSAPMRIPGRPKVRSHQALLAVLGAAEQKNTRAAILSEAVDALLSRGSYGGSVEELTPWADDPPAAIPVAVALAATLIHPSLWRSLRSGAVESYALTPEAWTSILTRVEGAP